MSIDLTLFNKAQLKQIEIGQKYLSKENVELFAKPEYSPSKMQELRMALEFGLSTPFIERLLDPKLSDDEIRYLRINAEKYGEEDLTYANIDKTYNGEVASLLKEKILNKKLLPSHLKYFHKDHQLHQITAIVYAIEEGFTDEKINILTGLDLTPKELKSLIDGIKKGYPTNIIKLARESSFGRIDTIFNAFDKGVKYDIIEFISSKKYSTETLKELYSISTSCDFNTFKILLEYLHPYIDNYAKFKDSSGIAVPAYSEENLYALINTISEGVDAEIIKTLSNPSISARAINLLTRSFKQDDRELFNCICDVSLTPAMMKKIKDAWVTGEYSKEQLYALKNVDEDRIELALKAFDYHLDNGQMYNAVIDNSSNPNTSKNKEETYKRINSTIKSYVKDNIVAEYNIEDDTTKELIEKGLDFNFEYNNILLYINPEYDYDKKREIVLCLIEEMPIKETFPDGFDNLTADNIRQIKHSFQVESFKENKALNDDFLLVKENNTKDTSR